MDFARSRGSLKRGGAAPAVSLGEAIEVPSEGGADLVALDDSLKALAAIDPRRKSSGGSAFLRRTEGGGSSRSAEGFSRDGNGRLEVG